MINFPQRNWTDYGGEVTLTRLTGFEEFPLSIPPLGNLDYRLLLKRQRIIPPYPDFPDPRQHHWPGPSW